MSFEALLEAAVISFAGVTAIIDDQIHPAPLPVRAQLPALTYQVITTGFFETHSGLGAVSARRVQWDCWAKDLATALDLATQLRLSFKAFNLAALPESPEVLRATPNIVLDQRTLSEPQSDPPIGRVIVDARHYYREE